MIIKFLSLIIAAASWILGMLLVTEANTTIFQHNWLTEADIYLQVAGMFSIIACGAVFASESEKEITIAYLVLILIRIIIGVILILIATNIDEIIANYLAEFIPCIAAVVIGIGVDIWGIIWWRNKVQSLKILVP